MYACMYVRIYICMHVHKHECRYICMHAYVYACRHVCMYINDVCLLVCVHIHIGMYVCTYRQLGSKVDRQIGKMIGKYE